MIWWFHIVIKSSWNILSSIVHKSSKQIRKCVKWSLKRGYNRHPVSSVGRAPVCRAGGRRFKPRPDRQSGSFFLGKKKKSGEIMLASIWHLVSVNMIASCILLSLVKIERGQKEPTLLFKRAGEVSPAEWSTFQASRIIHITGYGWVTISS